MNNIIPKMHSRFEKALKRSLIFFPCFVNLIENDYKSLTPKVDFGQKIHPKLV